MDSGGLKKTAVYWCNRIEAVRQRREIQIKFCIRDRVCSMHDRDGARIDRVPGGVPVRSPAVINNLLLNYTIVYYTIVYS